MKKGICVICEQEAQYHDMICKSCFDDLDWDEYAPGFDYATYDPQDNKLRIYSGRVAKEMFAALLYLGFQRAYKQGCFFVAWAPRREDVAVAVCNEIQVEEGLLDRAEEREERFAGYGGNAKQRESAAHRASEKATEGIPFGQPILVGHHSEKAHRKALERARSAATRAVQEGKKAKWWARRAKSAARYADKKLNAGTTQRRIERLEGELRKHKREMKPKKLDEHTSWIASHFAKELGYRANELFRNYQTNEWQVWLEDDTEARPLPKEQLAKLEKHIANSQERMKSQHLRWIAHLEGQIEYWKQFLIEQHGIDIDDQMELSKGDWVHSSRYGAWAQIVRVNKSRKTKRITSVSIDRETIFGCNAKVAPYLTHKWDYDRLDDHQKEKPES